MQDIEKTLLTSASDSPLEKVYSKSSELLMRRQTYEWKGIYVMLESHKNIETNRE